MLTFTARIDRDEELIAEWLHLRVDSEESRRRGEEREHVPSTAALLTTPRTYRGAYFVCNLATMIPSETQ